MRIGHIDQVPGPDLWVYDLSKHKTVEHISGRKIYLSEPARKLIEPYLKGKKPTDPVFTVDESVRERKAAKRAARKSKVTLPPY